MNYWLVKSEPNAYSWHDFTAAGRAVWDGVRNFQARNNLQAMQLNDQVLFYHSVTKPAVVGLARISRTAYPDPTVLADTSGKPTPWVVIELEPIMALAQPVSLAQIKTEPMLANMALIRQSRLSVMPVTRDEFELVLSLAERM